MYNQNTVQVQQLSFQQLPIIQNLTNSGNLIQQYIKGSSWTDSFNCITELRKINKYHSQFIPNIIQRYSATILDLLNTGKTLLVKNIFRLIKQLFDAGQQINVEKAVYAFLPLLIKKASTQIGYMKNSAQQVLTSFSCNCGYQISFVIASEYCCDKNVAIAQLSIKLLSVLIQKVGSGLMQVNQTTLRSIMKCLSILIDGNRKNLINSALDICILIYNSIGSENYLNLMQFFLKENQVQLMGSLMQTHRIQKQKPSRLKYLIQTRKTQKFNADFFQDQKLNNNFIPLPKKNDMNNKYQMNQVYDQNYNQNQFNHSNYQNYHNNRY